MTENHKPEQADTETLHQERLILIKELTQLLDDADSIKEQLGRASQKLAATGVRAESEWFSRAVNARRAKLYAIRQAQTLLTEVNLRIKQANTQINERPAQKSGTTDRIARDVLQTALVVCDAAQCYYEENYTLACALDGLDDAWPKWAQYVRETTEKDKAKSA